ncbi:MAG: PQQ-binding-like beta-propeller repeat protein [Prolixibacteraceae bacterium]
MTINDKLKLSQNVAIIAGIFCVVVALLLLLNYWQVSTNDPIESKALEALVERLQDEPNNEELKAEIRNFDLLARKAYFNSKWQVKTGAWLLLFGGIVLAVALRVYHSLKNKIEPPETHHENEVASRILAQKGVLIVGAVVFVFAFVASFSTVNYLGYYDVNAETAQVFEDEPDEEIEVINIDETPAKADEETDEKEVAEEPEESEVVAEAEVAETEAGVAEQADQVKSEQPRPQQSSSELTLAQLKENHNSFRGPLGQGIVYHENIPTEWNGADGTNICWKSPIPRHGYNSPVIWEDKVFVAGADEESREVYCYNKADGKLLWTGVADNIPGSPSTMPRVTEDTGLSAPTVATDGKHVYAIFGTGDVIAFDMTGKRVWAKNLGLPDNHYGHSSSLLVWNNKLIVQYDTNRGGRVLALNAANGETVWDKQRDARISWASPVLAEIDGKYQVLLTADPTVAAYDLENGEEIWAVEAMMGEVGPSVGFSDGVVFAANEYARLVAIDAGSGEILWENDEYLPEASSPLAHNGLLIICTSYGVMVCYDTKTGDQYWEHDVGTTLYSSPIYADGKLYMMDNDGVMRVYEYSKEMKLISENELGEISGSTPAFDNGHIYIRGEESLYCIGE